MVRTLLKPLAYLALPVVMLALFWTSILPAKAATGINAQINFQGRLLNAQGAIVPDGHYNIQFKIYQGGDGQTAGDTGGTLKWTESYLNANSQGVTIQNGYMSVQLGSITPFGTNIDWNQDTLWLSINVGGTGASCSPFTSCTPDGEMLPMKRLSANPYALNSSQLNGLTSSNFVQLAQGVQTDVANNGNSIYLNKTGTGGNFVDFQSAGVDVFAISNAGNISLGGNSDHTISIAVSGAGIAGHNLTIAAGNSGGGSTSGGNLNLQGGNGGTAGGNVYLDAGTGSSTAGGISIGTNSASNITIGAVSGSATQTILVGTNNSGGTSNLVLGSDAGAAAGTTTAQAKNSIIIKTNGIIRATFDNTNSIYFGNGVTAGSPSSFLISGTGSTTTGTAGGALTIQGGSATTGNANGGNVTISGGSGIGTGVNGLVILTTPTFSTTISDANCLPGGGLATSSCTVTASSVNNSSAVIVGFSTDGQTATLPDPTITTAGRMVYVTAANTSKDFTLAVNGGGLGNQIAMRQNTTATMIWNGNDWTAAGASSSTTLQAAYDNTLQSAGGAELVVSKTSATNGLTIRDSATNPVNGTLLAIQTSSAATLFSVNSNVTEYASDGGAEVAGGSSTTFPANTWAAVTSATVSRYVTVGDNIATGQASVSVTTPATANSGLRNTLNTALTAGQHYNVSFAARLGSGTFTDLTVYYSINGTAASTDCTDNQDVPTSVWAKINCTFTAPTTGITTGNAILIRQAGATAHTFYIDNLSVTIAADYNYATDGGVYDDDNFDSNWTAVGAAAVDRSNTYGQDASDSAQVVTTGANQGVRNKLSINPLPNTLYRVGVYVASTTSGFNSFTVRYSRDGGTNFVACADYNTQSVSSSLTDFTEITCYIKTDATAATNAYVYFTQTDATARTFYVDVFSMTLTSKTTPNVQIGGGSNGGPVTLLTLDRSASAPIATNNDDFLGSMYYDTTLGKLQCYEADGWGACGSSPDTIVTISPEYTNAVLHGTGVGTMGSDICSSTLGINDGSSGQQTICGPNETYNFYKWTSPQASAQTYGIYVTYQLPGTFKAFASGQTSLMGRTDSANSVVKYQVYRNNSGTGLTACGPEVPVSSGSVSSWQIGIATGAADPSTCGFGGGDSIVFKISVMSSQNADAYVGNLNFSFSNR